MELTRDTVFSEVQALFRAGLVTVVGSGASSAYGLPSMKTLAESLLEQIPHAEGLPQASADYWSPIAEALGAGESLEAVLLSHHVDSDLSNAIANVVADTVGQSESVAIAALVESEYPPTFSRLFSHILETNRIADVITTNYDRILEVSAALGGIRVDTMFYGHTLGRLDERLSREELLEPQQVPTRRSSVRVATRKHIRLAKPHGSLDWYCVNKVHFRSDHPIAGERQVIAPGENKYRRGYEIPFDRQRERANSAVDGAAAMLFIGYGFNDDHLQTHIRSRFEEVPSLILARTLSDKAHDFLSTNAAAIGIESDPNSGGCRIYRGESDLIQPEQLWQVEILLEEVLKV